MLTFINQDARVAAAQASLDRREQEELKKGTSQRLTQHIQEHMQTAVNFMQVPFLLQSIQIYGPKRFWISSIPTAPYDFHVFGYNMYTTSQMKTHLKQNVCEEWIEYGPLQGCCLRLEQKESDGSFGVAFYSPIFSNDADQSET